MSIPVSRGVLRAERERPNRTRSWQSVEYGLTEAVDLVETWVSVPWVSRSGSAWHCRPLP